MEFLLSHTATTCPDPYMQQGGVMVRVSGLDYA
jgi:hypothetical protein